MATLESLLELDHRRRDVVAVREREDRRRSLERERNEERASVTRLTGLLRDTITRAHNGARLLLERREADENLKLLDTVNPDFVDVPTIRKIEYVGWAALLPAAYVLDCLLFAPNARHLAQRSFPGNSTMIVSMSFVIPGIVIALENGIGNYLIDWRENQRKRVSHTFAVWSAAVLSTVVMPALVAATQWAIQPTSSSNRLAAMFTFQSIALVAMALLTHGLIVFGGRRARDSKAFVAYKAGQLRFRRQNRRLNNNYEADRRAMADTFMEYRRELDVFNVGHPDTPISAGPFDRKTAEELNEWFGYEVVILEGQTANGLPGSGRNDEGAARAVTDPTPEPQPEPRGWPAPGADSPSPTPDSGIGDDGVEEYYRSLLLRRITDEESEVRPPVK